MTSDRVTTDEGVVIGTGGGRDLLCDVYRPPAGAANGLGVLIIIHGGAWRSGSRQQLRGYGILLGRKGYVSVCSEYRLSGESKWPAQIEDAKAALRWMRARSHDLGIDRARIAVYGMSAGAHLALMLGATPNMPEFEGSGGQAGTGTDVSVVMANYAPTDLGSAAVAAADPDGEPILELMGSDAGDSAYRAASPITYAHAGFPPTLLMHGNADETVPVSESLAMHQALLDAGAPVELHTFDGAPHTYDAERDYAVLCGEIMAMFLQRHLPG